MIYGHYFLEWLAVIGLPLIFVIVAYLDSKGGPYNS
jgi:uncharacterized membrane protein